MKRVHDTRLACGLLALTGLLGIALPAAGASVTPRGAGARDAFEALEEKGLRVVQLGRERDLLVPAELRFKPSDGRALVEAVARLGGRKVAWAAGGRTAVILRDAPEAEVAAALKAMQAADAPTRAAAVKRAGELDDPRVIEPLLAAVADADPNVAREAMSALAHLGWPAVAALAPTEKVVDALARGLERKDPGGPDPHSIVRNAASALPEIRDEKVLELVEKTLGWGGPDNWAGYVRRHAAFALGTIGGEKVLPLVGKAAGDKHPWVAEVAPLGLRGLDVGNDDVRAIVEKALSNPRDLVRSAAASALRASGEKALPLLEKAMTDKSSYVRVTAVLAAGRIGGDKALALVEKALWGRSDGHGYHGSGGLGIHAVRGAAAFALGYIGGEKTLPHLEKAIQDGSYAVRRGAVWSLGRVGGAGAVAVAGKALEHKDSVIREYAVWALGAIGDERGLPLVEKALADADALVRWNAAAVLGEIGGEQALAVAGKALGDKDPNVRGSAALALGEIGGEKALALIEKVIGDDDPAVRRDAAGAAGRTGVARARDVLAGRLGAEPEPEIRSAVLASLRLYFPDDPAAAVKPPPADPGWTDPARAGSASGPLPAEMALAGKGGAPVLVRTTVGGATGRRILSSWEGFFRDRGLAVEAAPADRKPAKPAAGAVLAFETEADAPAATAAGIDLGPLKNAREEAYLLVARKHDDKPLVAVIGKTARGTDAGAAWLLSKVGWDGAQLTVPPLQEFRNPFFRVREAAIGANGRELAGQPAWQRHDNYECWDESELRRYPPYLRACGFNALELAECDTYRNGGRGRDEDVRRPIATMADAGRDEGLPVKFYIFGSSDGLYWADPITQPLKKARYRELARRYGRFTDVINTHWVDDGDEYGYQTPLEGTTFLWREFRKQNPDAEGVCDAWSNDYLYYGIADERWAPREVGIALHQWYHPGQARQVLASGRRCGIWGWYVSDYEMTFGSHLVARHMEERYYSKLPDAAAGEIEWLSTELTHHRLPSEIDLYLTAQKMWNPKRPRAGIMLDYCRAVYGPANAEAMRLVYETVEAGQGPFIREGEYKYPKVLGTPEFTAKAKQALAALDGVKLPDGWRPNFAPMGTPAEHIASLRKSLEAHIQGKPHDWAGELRGPPPAR